MLPPLLVDSKPPLEGSLLPLVVSLLRPDQGTRLEVPDLFLLDLAIALEDRVLLVALSLLAAATLLEDLHPLVDLLSLLEIVIALAALPAVAPLP